MCRPRDAMGARPLLTRFEVALFLGFRPKGLAVYLAQAEGLGMDIEWIVRAEGPAVCIATMG